ncbi:MAG: lysophospholipid acyltransferase family protein [Desulfobacterales bacterium]|jgi:KDO2-lipid IV(A) lauroyltransferase|nr:lysophospholipid acyltransferase family protein [Desulfobacterales bacterium]
MLGTSIVRLPALLIGSVLGRLLYLLGGSPRRVVRRNLSFAYPELSADQRRRMTGLVFQNYGVNLFELFQMGFMRPEDVARRVRFYGLENFRDALQRKRGVIAVSAHLGSWELGVQALPCVFGTHLTAVAKKFKSNFVESRIHSVRTRFGNAILYKKDSLGDMTKILRNGGILAILVDMARRKDGVDVIFFGKKATATPAVAMLALRCRSAVLPTFCIREPDGRIGIHVEPEIEMRRTKDLRADLVDNTQRITDMVERMVRRHPEQWFWLMRRWKEHYPHLYE